MSGQVVLPASAEALTKEWASRSNSPVVYHAHFVPETLDHKLVKFTPNFSSDNKGYLKMLPKGIGMGFIIAD